MPIDPSEFDKPGAPIAPKPQAAAPSIPTSVHTAGFSKFIVPAIGISIILLLGLFISKQKSPVPEPLVATVVPRTVHPNKPPSNIKPQPEVNNPPKLTEPQGALNFTVTISSSPSGATIYLDRNWVGITPFTTTLKKGLYGIKIEKDGYQLKTGQIEDGQQNFYVELLPE